MKNLKNLLLLIAQLSGGRWVIAVLSVAMACFVMIVFGVMLAVKYGYLFMLFIIILATTLLINIPLLIIFRSNKVNDDQVVLADSAEADGLVKSSAMWSQSEALIWDKSKVKSRELLEEKSDWGTIHQISLEVLEFVANEFGKKALDFSVVEGLQLIEEVSRRYKVVMQRYLPGVEILKVSYLKEGYAAYEQYGELGAKAVKLATWANYVKTLYLNPAKFAADIIKAQSTSTATSGFLETLQDKAKRALLDEVISVAIDLYSGRFSFEEKDVHASSIADKDTKRIAFALEPIRIVLVGQTGAGKSSIINQLKQQLEAEVDVLPSTDIVAVYEATVDEIPIRIIDQKGLDGSSKTQKSMLAEMTQADLIIWVLKANQPARELDTTLKAKFDAFYENFTYISRKKPALIGVVNQVDNLKPENQWQPPYNIAEPSDIKAKTIKQAFSYNQSILNFDTILALSIHPDKQSLGVEDLIFSIREAIADAHNVQRNRQRVEVMKSGIGLNKQLKRVLYSGKKLYPNMLKSAVPNVNHSVSKKSSE